MKKIIKAGATSQTIDLFIQDSTSTTGGGKTGLAYNTASLTAYYRKGATGSATAITLATQTVGGAYSSGGFVEIDATNMPGMYRLDLPNAAIDTAGSVSLMLKGASGMAPLPIELQVIAADLDNATTLGLTNLDATVSSRLATSGYTAPLDAAGTRSAVGLAAANLDTQIGTLATAAALTVVDDFLDTEIAAIKAKTDNLPANPAATTDIPSVIAITSNIKKNQALSSFVFLMTDSTNHAPATGLTVSVTRSIDGAAFAAGTLSAVTEVGSGVYKVDFGAGDLNGNVILLKATAASADTAYERIVTQP